MGNVQPFPLSSNRYFFQYLSNQAIGLVYIDSSGAKYSFYPTAIGGVGIKLYRPSIVDIGRV